MLLSKLAVLNVVLGALAIVFVVIGFATHGWIRFKMINPDFTMSSNVASLTEIRVSVGLWSSKVCSSGICATIKTNDDDTPTNRQFSDQMSQIDSFTHYQVVMSLSLGAIFLGGLFLLLHTRRSLLTTRCNGILTVILNGVAGCLMWYCVARFSKISTNLHPLLGYPQNMTVMAPYSVILIAFGATLAIAVGSLIVVDICRTCNTQGGVVLNRQPMLSGVQGGTHVQVHTSHTVSRF